MSIVACPRCRDEVTLPPKLSPQARVRCPLCRDEYILSEALAKMPPALIVLDPGPDAEVGGYAEPEYKVAGESAGSMTSGGVFDTTGPMDSGATAPRPAMRGGIPKKKKEGSAIGMMIQVVLGGVGAFLLVNPVVWWLRGEDPFGTAPFVYQYVPGIVPEPVVKLIKAAKKGDSKTEQATNNTKPTPKPGNGKKTNGPGNNALANDPTDVKPILDPTDIGAPPTIPPEPGEIKIDDPLAPPVPGPTVKPVPEKGVDFTPPMPKPVDPNATPQVSSLAIGTAFAQAVAKREAFEQSTAEDAAARQARGREMYDAAAELGKLCTNADFTDPDNADHAAAIKGFAAQLKPRIPMLTFLSDERLNDEAGKDSIAVAGVIKSFLHLGKTQETTIAVTRRDGTLFTLPIITLTSLENEGAKLGDTVMVFGRIIREPKKDLPIYKGEAPFVIQAGAATLLPAE